MKSPFGEVLLRDLSKILCSCQNFSISSSLSFIDFFLPGSSICLHARRNSYSKKPQAILHHDRKCGGESHFVRRGRIACINNFLMRIPAIEGACKSGEVGGDV